MAQVAPAGTYSGVAHVAKQIMAKEGIKGFYKGLVPVLVRAFPANAACFLVGRFPFGLALLRVWLASRPLTLSAAPCSLPSLAFPCCPLLLSARVRGCLVRTSDAQGIAARAR